MKLPIQEWFAIRRHWTNVFDMLMPIVTIQTADGQIGKLVELVRRKCRIRVAADTEDEHIIDIDGDLCKIILTPDTLI